LDCNLELTVSRDELVTNGDRFTGEVNSPKNGALYSGASRANTEHKTNSSVDSIHRYKELP
jgi:hypothetical protein